MITITQIIIAIAQSNNYGALKIDSITNVIGNDDAAKITTSLLSVNFKMIQPVLVNWSAKFDQSHNKIFK